MAKKQYLNEKTGQLTTDLEVAKKSIERTGETTELTEFKPGPLGKTFTISTPTGSKQVSQEEYEKIIAPKREAAEASEFIARGGRAGLTAEEKKRREETTTQTEEKVIKPSEQLSAELEEKITSQPDLEPAPLTERASGALDKTAEIGLIPAAIGGNLITAGIEKLTGKEFGRVTAAGLADTDFGKFLGNATLGAGALGATLAAYPVLASVFAGNIVTKVMATKILSLNGAMGAVAGYFGTKQVLDYKGGELDTMRDLVGSFTEDGERLQSLTLQGLDPETTLEILQSMSNEVDEAESVIKQIGNNNIQFRYEKEYFKDMKDIRSARLALQRRTDAVINIAQTGSANLQPEVLVYGASQF